MFRFPQMEHSYAVVCKVYDARGRQRRRLTFFSFIPQDLEDRPARRMDRLRRSLRSSLRRKKNKDGGGGGGGGDHGVPPVPAPTSRLPSSSARRSDRGDGAASSSSSSAAGRQHQWQADEVAVRSGTCSFQVKVRRGEIRYPKICFI